MCSMLGHARAQGQAHGAHTYSLSLSPTTHIHPPYHLSHTTPPPSPLALQPPSHGMRAVTINLPAVPLSHLATACAVGSCLWQPWGECVSARRSVRLGACRARVEAGGGGGGGEGVMVTASDLCCTAEPTRVG